jgi:ABC-2 type transport system permease protein
LTVGTLGWRLLPIFFLSVRQFVGGRAVRAVFALGMIPALFALIYVLSEGEDPRRFVDDIIREVMLPSVLPLATLILATSAFGDEIDDRTLPYLVLKPSTRIRIVLEKWLAALFVSIPIIGFGGALYWVMVFAGDGLDNLDLLWAILAATAGGVAVYSSVFMLMSLLIGRAILASIVYSIVWESVLGRFIPGLRYLSIRHLVVSIYTSTIEAFDPSGRRDRGLGIDNAFAIDRAIIGAAVVSLVAILLATWRLRRINVE